MISFPEVSISKKTQNYRIVEKFLTIPYWENKILFSKDIEVEYPFAPPGMIQKMIPFEFFAHCMWMQKVISNWKATEVTIIPTTDENLFWAIREEQADMILGMRSGKYINECVFRIVLEDGKIKQFREYGNPHAYYDVMNIILPAFRYQCDTKQNVPCMRMKKGEKSKFSPEKNLKRAIANYANPITGNDGDPEPIYADNVVEVTPYSAYDHTLYCSGKEFDIHMEWMFRNVLEWNTQENAPFYQSTDPKVIIVESYGYGKTSWGGRIGHYMQRELQIAHMNEEGKVDHFRVYYNPLYEYTSMNQNIPTIPYFNY